MIGDKSMSCKLIAQKGPSTGTTYELDQPELFIGRDLSNDIVINDPEISRRHARLYKQAGKYVLEDLGSTNGTNVNGERLHGPKQLTHQDHITIGQSIEFTFTDSSAILTNDATVAASNFPQLDEDATMVASGSAYEPLPIPTAEYATPEVHIPSEFAQMPDLPESTIDEPSTPTYPGQWGNISTPQPAVQKPVASNSSGQVKGGKKKFPIWLIIVIILLLVSCVCVVGLFVIDKMNVWCDILPFLPGCPVL